MDSQAQKIRSINDPGWDGLNAKPEINQFQANEVDLLYQRVFSTEEGQKVLAHLESMTIAQPAWVPGTDPSYGYAREGQNSLIREIQTRLRRATNG